MSKKTLEDVGNQTIQCCDIYSSKAQIIAQMIISTLELN